MLRIFRALALAAHDAVGSRMLGLMLLPAGAALILWGIAGWIYWTAWTAWVGAAFAGTWLMRASESWGGWLVPSASTLLVFVLLIPAVIVTALLINELVVMPLVLRYVRQRHYPELAMRGFGTAWGSLVNVLVSSGIFAALWVLTVPLWFTVIGAVLAPLVNAAYLNMRVFRYDVLAEHATAEEYAAITRHAGGGLFGLGLSLSLLYYVPVVNLVAPVVSALAYAHFCLNELRRLRAAAVQRS